MSDFVIFWELSEIQIEFLENYSVKSAVAFRIL